MEASLEAEKEAERRLRLVVHTSPTPSLYGALNVGWLLLQDLGTPLGVGPELPSHVREREGCASSKGLGCVQLGDQGGLPGREGT